MVNLIGIDFSGDVRRWTERTMRSNVWIATASYVEAKANVIDVVRVQELTDTGHPFDRLSKLIKTSNDAYIGIDAPFSIPKKFLSGSAEEAWRRIADLPRANRPFPSGKQLVQEFIPDCPDSLGYHEWRATEEFWRKRNVIVRSPVSAKHRGGAPMTAACMMLLARHNGPIWPFRDEGNGAVICEAFPAAQLCQWHLPHTRYNDENSEAHERRKEILRALVEKKGLQIDAPIMQHCLNLADALDAVLCLFAAAAVATRQNLSIGANAATEGWIAVHE